MNELCDDAPKCAGGWGMQLHCLVAGRVDKAQATGMQQQTMAGEQFAEQSVVTTFAIGGIADEWMKDMLEVTSNLVHATGLRDRADQRVAGAGIAPDRIRQFHSGQVLIAGTRSLLTATGFECVVDQSLSIHMPPDHRQVALGDGSCHELSTQVSRTVGIQCKQQQPGSGPVQAVHRPDPFAKLIAQHLHGKT